jgi:hypothetical protein
MPTQAPASPVLRRCGGRPERRDAGAAADGGGPTPGPADGSPGSPRRPARPALGPAARPSSSARRSVRASFSGPLVRRARLVALAVGAFLVPWCVLLSATLPATTRVPGWSLAWTGLDGGEAIAALATAVLLARQDLRAALTAVAGGALLLADAWFDVCTSAGSGHAVATAEAVFVELPLAGSAFWLALKLTRGTP